MGKHEGKFIFLGILLDDNLPPSYNITIQPIIIIIGLLQMKLKVTHLEKLKGL